MLLICLTSANKQEPMPNAHILETCLAEIAKDNKDAFSELYQKTSVSVYGFALSILKNAQDAEDILHDCYLNIYSAAEHYRAQGKPMAWILTIAKNLCFSKLRERKKEPVGETVRMHASEMKQSEIEPLRTRGKETVEAAGTEKTGRR